MQESMATEVLNLEDAHYFLSLEETRLDRAAAQHRTPLTNRPRIGFNTVLGKFIYACRLDDLQSDLASSSASGDAPTDARRAALQSKHHNLYPAPPETDVDEYKSVCAEKGDLRTTTAELSCVMWTGDGDPRLILAPLKLEVLSLTPRVVVFADFLTPSEVAYIQDTGHTGLKRGAIYDSGNPSGVTSYKRISKVSWLWDTEHPFLSSLGRRISLASGLSLESSEAYQVANYGLGGHYTAHNDARDFEQVADEWYTRDGNRVATMLLYLTDVSLGGATAFVRLQLAVKPRRGSALFWPIHFDFWHQKKTQQQLTRHVGCPVLWGTKWIATKWIRERNNVVVRFDYPG
ncbi:hypothetical protein HPB52_020107 [Rhipicephalus sanguineus]|uniref:Fe2OG dioxygenase domain-containing protein n=1 Tax=Rhipicephalus sanguineus TaxID=34632 RepID=A0A9D4PJR7_RHISA|nr:hypothetical protein HPB52_020107 [Rhipicephalus sanguineus]